MLPRTVAIGQHQKRARAKARGKVSITTFMNRLSDVSGETRDPRSAMESPPANETNATERNGPVGGVST
jgi:hypothetical protein